MRRSAVASAALAAVVVAGGAVLAVARPWAPSEAEPVALELEGDLAVHDPALVVGDEGEPWFVYSTGDLRVGFGAPQIRRSDDGGRTWEPAGTAWDASGDPAWVRDPDTGIAGVENYWAPELVEHDGTWYLYYSASTFGSNSSAIGLATASTLDPADPDFGWTDQGMVIRSTAGTDDYNAIDPGVVTDDDGRPWLFFGSFWGGIQRVSLAWPSGKPADDAEPVTVARRSGVPDPAIEAPYVAEHDGWYYLFVSWDRCCAGEDSTYSIHVGRARDVTGPFLDKDGRDMADGGGSLVLGTDGARIGPGGQSLSQGYLGYHFYDGENGGAPRLGIQRLGWDDDGWPVAR
ncbi:arabinan endo-1,5-alpha-L-arabinosidase [Isoptericola sp. F-RaC21]|uniref:arabinan endo-1,5-alpha-L-arabinosidase n=1 Tax=Isoptericola sp. F-RaC21 TaxID=3141452 RepID=UPI00315B6C2F